MYLHNETYRTYLLFAKMEVGKFLQGHSESGFDENLYMSRENMKNLSREQQMEMAYFPVSVMVVEENYEITDRHTDVITNTSVRAKRPPRGSKSAPRGLHEDFPAPSALMLRLGTDLGPVLDVFWGPRDLENQ